eukprot:75728-Alexandrium_andersonii.AAC.1
MPCGLAVHENLKCRPQLRRVTTPATRPSGGGLESGARASGPLVRGGLAGPGRKRSEINGGP